MLLLIDGFSANEGVLDGRVKLAKLDFFLRYPTFFARALRIRTTAAPAIEMAVEAEAEGASIESRMIRFRYGPWDPAYYGILSRLIGMGLVEIARTPRTLGYRTTQEGRLAAAQIAETPEWNQTRSRVKVLKRHFNLTGTNLMKFVYENFPEIKAARMGSRL